MGGKGNEGKGRIEVPPSLPPHHLPSLTLKSVIRRPYSLKPQGLWMDRRSECAVLCCAVLCCAVCCVVLHVTYAYKESSSRSDIPRESSTAFHHNVEEYRQHAVLTCHA